ncbi:MAG: alpha/beta-type small acid-soluble spore protein [Elusimicrobiales bacterium]|nr:alpha/beta-type small acid-soluble spore protein [Elusimicrobiales bacterium]
MGTSREVGVNLKEGYNGDLTSREAGSVGGQMVNDMTPVRTANYERADRTAPGHVQHISYMATITA